MRCVVHIGTEKTGTTSIQESLEKNSSLLAKSGILYPPALSKGRHAKIACYAMDYNTVDRRKKQFGLFDKATTDSFRKTFEADFEKSLNGHDTVLIVNEHLSRLRNVSEVERLKSFLSRFFDDIRVVVYLRRQDKLMRSMYSTRIKLGLTSNDVYPVWPKKANTVFTHYDFKRILVLWTEVWGREVVVPRIFERNLLVNKDALSDFCQIAEVQLPEDFVPVRANESISPQALVAVRELNKNLPKEWKFRGDIGRIAARCFPGDGIPVSRRESLEFLAHFEDGNDYVARSFFSREKLFPPIKEDEFVSADKTEEVPLLVTDMARIFAGLWADSSIQKKNLSAERDLALKQNKKLTSERDEAFKQRKKLIAERDEALKQKKKISAERNWAHKHPWRNLWNTLRSHAGRVSSS